MKISYGQIFSALMMLLVFSLAFVYPFVVIANQRIPYTDFIFIPLFLFWIGGLLLKKISFEFHFFFFLLVFYWLAMLVSVIYSENPKTSFLKFAGEIYLFLLSVIFFNFVRNLDDAKKIILAWLSGTIFVLLISILTIVLFYFYPENPLLNIFRNHYGTVPAGNFPRIRATFFHSNMLCNYLSVSLMLAIAAGKIGWINPVFSKILIGLILFVSIFTFSPGLGGIALSLGIICWLFSKTKNRKLIGKASLAGGILISSVFLALLIFAMEYHPTALFVFQVPFTEKVLYPSSRVLVWSATLETFTDNFWSGVGVGQQVCRVRYLNPSGVLEDLRDGHNVILNVSAQTGILGLLSITAIIAYLLRKSLKFRELCSAEGIFFNCCCAAVISAFIYQGISGSFEETRHLWVLFGLFLAAERLTNKET